MVTMVQPLVPSECLQNYRFVGIVTIVGMGCPQRIRPV